MMVWKIFVQRHERLEIEAGRFDSFQRAKDWMVLLLTTLREGDFLSIQMRAEEP